MTNLIDTLERRQVRQIPDFRVGDRVRVHFQVVEGTRRRTQVFEGVVLKQKGGSSRRTFTVRKLSFGVGVERTFPVHSPKIERIEVVGRGEVRRAKLYYLRDRVGRAARLREIRDFRPEDVGVLAAPEPEAAPDGEAAQPEGDAVAESAEVTEPAADAEAEATADSHAPAEPEAPADPQAAAEPEAPAEPEVSADAEAPGDAAVAEAADSSATGEAESGDDESAPEASPEPAEPEPAGDAEPAAGPRSEAAEQPPA